MKDKYISFVVPVYNVQKYLVRCMQSLLKQDIPVSQYEIVLVDDGSTDTSGKICEWYSRRYSNVRYFRKENGGLSDARNYGLCKAKGTYILFVDSDDFIAENILQTLIRECKKQKEPDVLFLMAQKVFPNGAIKKYEDQMEQKALRAGYPYAVHYLAKRNSYPASACCKMINKKFLIENNIYFRKGQKSEDYEWSLSVILKATKYGCCNKNYYFYRQNREGSITDKVDEKHVRDLMQIIHRMEFLSKKKEYKVVSEDILKFASYVYRCLLWWIAPYYKKYKKEIRKLSYLLNRKNSTDIRMIRIAIYIAGMGNTVKLLSIYKKIRHISRYFRFRGVKVRRI